MSLNRQDKREVGTWIRVAAVVTLLPIGLVFILTIPWVGSNLVTILRGLLIVLGASSVILLAVGLSLYISNYISTRMKQNKREPEHERSDYPEREESRTELRDQPQRLADAPQQSSTLQKSSPEDRALLAALRATAPLAPLAAVSATTSIFLIFGGVSQVDAVVSDVFAFIFGFVATVLIWLVLALFYRPYTSAASASRRTYNSLRERLSHLQNRLRYDHPEGYGPQDEPEDSIYRVVRRQAHAYAEEQCIEIKRALKSRGMPWVTGLGYVELWHRVHRAEEALIKVEPYPEALEGAIRDESRLIDSTMKNKSSLLRRLYRAAVALDYSMSGDVLNYFKGQEELSSLKEQQAAPESHAEALASRAKALTVLSEVRYEINAFRDNVWEGIVHARNRLVETSVVLGFAAYALLALAIFSGASHTVVLWVATYFLVGTIAGLFARAQAEWSADTAVDDFGLSTARLLHIPWLSGLAAVGVVLIIGVFRNLINSHAGASSLTTIFDGRPSLLIIAVVFGLTPDLIIRSLTQQVDRYKQDLQSTQIGTSTEGAQSIDTEQQSR
jgi:hypothetical protein